MFDEPVLRKTAEVIAPSHTALIIVDMQKDFLAPDGAFAKAGRDISDIQNIIPNCRRLIDAARDSGALVVFIRQLTLPNGRSDGPAWYAFKTRDGKSSEYTLIGSDGAQIIPELEPLPGEVVIDKFRPSAFHGTFLGQLLRANGIRSTVCIGINAEGCLMATVLDSSFDDYYTCVVEDAVSSSLPEMKKTAFDFMRRRFRILQTDEVVAEWEKQTKK